MIQIKGHYFIIFINWMSLRFKENKIYFYIYIYIFYDQNQTKIVFLVWKIVFPSCLNRGLLLSFISFLSSIFTEFSKSLKNIVRF